MQNISLDDIKQLLEATIGQSEARIMTHMNASFAAFKSELRLEMHAGFAAIRSEFRQELASGLASFRQEMTEGFAAVGDAFSDLNDRLDKRDRVTDQRLTRLESRSA